MLRAAGSPNQPVVYEFTPGWNSFSLPIYSMLKASDLCLNIDGAQSVARFSLGWQYYDCGFNTSGADFNLVPFAGYFIYLKNSYRMELAGKNAGYNYPVRLKPGWNFTGVPESLVKSVYASDICNKTSRDSKVLVVSRREGNLWSDHTCGLPFNDFQVSPYSGYFIKTEDIANQPQPVTEIPDLKVIE